MDTTMNEKSFLKKWSEIAPKRVDMQGVKVEVDAILNKQITITDFEILTSDKFKQGGKFAVIQAELDGKKIIFNGSEAIANQLEKIRKEDLPFSTTVRKEKSPSSGFRYNTLS